MRIEDSGYGGIRKERRAVIDEKCGDGSKKGVGEVSMGLKEEEGSVVGRR